MLGQAPPAELLLVSYRVAPAVLVSWPGEDDGWTVESATSVDGPWAPSDATPFTQDGRHSVAVPTDGEHRFFRLR